MDNFCFKKKKSLETKAFTLKLFKMNTGGTVNIYKCDYKHHRITKTFSTD